MQGSEIYKLLRKKKNLGQIREIFNDLEEFIPHQKKDLNTWGNVENLIQNMSDTHLEKLYNEIEVIDNIRKNVSLADIREALNLLDVNFITSHLSIWKKACSFLRTLNNDKMQKILDYFSIIYPYLRYTSLSRLEETVTQLRIIHSKKSFFSRNSALKWLISLDKNILLDIAKEFLIDRIFRRCDNIKIIEKILNYEYDKKSRFSSWEVARFYLSKEFNVDQLDYLEFGFYDIFFELDEFQEEMEVSQGEEKLNVFISYSIEDKDLFNIGKIAEKLKSYPNINIIYYDKNADDNIITYMSEGIKQCDILMLFCSENTDNSDSVKDEWTAAYKKSKKIIPIFIDDKYIPDLISTRRGVKYDMSNLNKNIDEIKKIILIKGQELKKNENQ